MNCLLDKWRRISYILYIHRSAFREWKVSSVPFHPFPFRINSFLYTRTPRFPLACFLDTSLTLFLSVLILVPLFLCLHFGSCKGQKKHLKLSLPQFHPFLRKSEPCFSLRIIYMSYLTWLNLSFLIHGVLKRGVFDINGGLRVLQWAVARFKDVVWDSLRGSCCLWNRKFENLACKRIKSRRIKERH